MAISASSSTSRTPLWHSPRRLATMALLTLIGLLVTAQFVPYGRDHTNPATVAEPTWDSAETRALFKRACADCHSNETVWPWYSNVAPMSWLVARDVNEGRAAFNVSEWGRPKNKGDEAAETVQKGEMPPWFYLPLHPDAKLTATEQQHLIQGLTATFGEKGESTGTGGEGGEGGE